MTHTLPRVESRTRKKNRCAGADKKPLPAEFSWARYADTRLQQLEEAAAGDTQHEVHR